MKGSLIFFAKLLRLSLVFGSLFLAAAEVEAAETEPEFKAKAEAEPKLRTKDEIKRELDEIVSITGIKNLDRKSRNPQDCEAQLGDRIEVTVEHFDRWCKLQQDYAGKDKDGKQIKPEGVPERPTLDALVPRLGELHLNGTRPVFVQKSEKDKETVYTLTFVLSRTDENREAWQQLLTRGLSKRRENFTLSFDTEKEGNASLFSNYFKGPGESEANIKKFYLSFFPTTGIGLIAPGIIFLLLAAFVWLAFASDILCDPSAPRRPDGCLPYSLARCQMAFWYFLVVAAFLYIWVMTGRGDVDTINTSVLALLGISAGTALGAALVDAEKNSTETPNPSGASVDADEAQDATKRKKTIDGLQRQENTLKESGLKPLIEEYNGLIGKGTKEELQANLKKQSELRDRIAQLRRDREYFKRGPVMRFAFDLLTEQNAIAFHRFQIIGWTFVLGYMFVVDVYTKLAMPQFSATLLGLLGISAGTYVGFKVPAQKQPDA